MSIKFKKSFISELEENPHDEGLKLNKTQLEVIIKEASRLYYSSDQNLISDKTFDILQDILKEKDPNNELLKQIGSIEPVINKVKLPYFMGSMDKVKPDSKELERYLSKYKGPYIVSEKLDGLSALLVIKINDSKTDKVDLNMQLFSRGTGDMGQNISKLVGYINIFNKINIKDFIMKCFKNNLNKVVIRGELIVSKENYNKKYSKKFNKARSLVSGMIHSKKIDETNKHIVNDINFVGYEVIEPSLNPIQQFKLLDELKFHVANNKEYKTLNTTNLKQILLEFKEQSKYEIDGIILTDVSKKYPRVTGNPKHSVAFKMLLDEQVESTEIINVEYNASKHGVLVPRIKFKQINIGGDNISYTTGFYAKYIKDNKLGPGAKIKIVRSGDVIPYIYQVLSHADEWQKPDENLGEWEWNNSGLEAVLINKTDNLGVRLKRLIHFFTTLNVPGLKSGVIERLYNAGYDDIKKIISLKPDMISSLEGFKLKSATNLYNAIHSIIDKEISLDVLMTASNIFGEGFGVKKLKLVLDKYPNILDTYNNFTIDKLNEIDGYSDKSSKKFLENIPKFKEWLQNHPQFKYTYTSRQSISSNDSNDSNNNKFKDYVVVFTGIRDDKMQSIIENGGGKVTNSVNSKTTLVIAKDPNDKKGKIKKAEELNINIISYENAKKLIK